MPNYYLNALQLNTGTVQCSLIGYDLSKSFNNNRTTQYGKNKVLLFPVSGNAEKYVFELMLWTKTGTYSDLLAKEKAIIDLINNQVNNHETIAFSSDTTPVWFDEPGDVYLTFNDSDYSARATDGKSFIALKFEATVESVT